MTTQLPEPQFIERDADKITKEWIAMYEKITGKTLQPAQIERLMINVGAYRKTVLRMDVQETAKKNLLSYAPLEVLEHIGEPFGVERLKANSAVTLLRFTIEEPLDFDYIIKYGTEVETKDGLFIFCTEQSATIAEGETSVEVKAVCEVKGTAANNYAAGSINNLITPLNYISNVANITVSSGGADDEGEESLRSRIRLSPEKFSNAGSKGAYRYHTLSAHQSITDVSILSPSPGVVAIYPLTVEGNPSEELIKLVQDYLSDDSIRPLTDLVKVMPPKKTEFSIKAVIYLYMDADSESVVKTVELKMKGNLKSVSRCSPESAC